VQGSPSQVNGVGLRTLSRRRSWVRIPPPAPRSDPIAFLLPVVLKLKSDGRKDSTVVPILKRLKFLAKKADVYDPEKVKAFIAGQSYTDGYKDNLIDAYCHFCRYYGIQWTKPKYMREERITQVPREENINKIISHGKLRYAVAFSVLRDSGMRPVELGMLKVKDFDLETGDVYPTAAKHGSGRVLRIKKETLSMLKRYISETNLTSMDILWNCKRVKQNWSRLKTSVARKLGEPQLLQIRLYDLRHFAGSMTYYRTKDIIYTMRFLGHKSIKNTLRYVHLIDFNKDDYHVSVAKTVDEACKLVEQGFEYVTEMDGVKLFRKRK
jgi:integrase